MNQRYLFDLVSVENDARMGPSPSERIHLFESPFESVHFAPCFAAGKILISSLVITQLDQS